MARIEITIPEFLARKVGEYACECQKGDIDMNDRRGKVFWSAECNDNVKKGDVLCEVDTGKAVAEIKAACDGQLQEILIAEGGVCTMGSVLGILQTPA